MKQQTANELMDCLGPLTRDRVGRVYSPLIGIMVSANGL